MADTAIADTIRELGSFGVVALSFILIMRYLLEQHKKDMRVIADELAANARAIRAISSLMVSLQKQFALHDLTVRGLNPSTGADVDERAQQALKVYHQMIDSMDEVKRKLLDLDTPAKAGAA